jgi:hypothetical protein
MFLGVSGTVPLVNEDDRKQLGELITRERKRQYGTKSAAYKEAGVNAATWDRAEDGQPVREDRLTAIVRLLWPNSQGDPAAAMARATNEWANWEDSTTPMAPGETENDRVASWAAEHFERINQALAEMADTVEALSRKVGMTNGTQASPEKNELDRARQVKDERDREKLSDPDETKEAAADRFDPESDKEPGGSDDLD